MAKTTRRIAVVNQKGGVGKTTTTINAGAALAAAGQKVLLVDLDPQGALTEGLGIDAVDGDTSLSNALAQGDATGLTTIVATVAERLDVLPTDDGMFLVETRLVSLRGRERRLSRVLDVVAESYDIVLIDCPPSLGLLTDNALLAAGEALVPVQLEDTSLKALEILLDQIDSLKQHLDHPVVITGIVANLVEDNNVAKRVSAALAQLPFPLLASVRKRTRLREAWAEGRTILDLDTRSDAADAYRGLAAALLATAAAA
jgi:chromosome partitioning protein